MSVLVAIILARGGSKGIPRKNLADCAGKPLLQWTIEAALEAKKLTAVFVSSEDKEILAFAHRCGAGTMIRPKYLAKDDTSTEAVLKYHLRTVMPDIAVLLQPTSPVRTGKQIDEAIEFIGRGFDSVVSVVPSHTFLWDAQTGEANYDYINRPRRQDWLHSVEENGSIYVFTMEQWRGTHNRLGGRIGFYIMGPESRIQIDTPLDLYLVSKILERKIQGGL